MEFSGDREKNFPSESKTNTETSKSAKSVKSGRRKSEISLSTIIASIEREVSDLMAEITIRSQKNKLLSIGEYFKLLTKRIPFERDSSTAIHVTPKVSTGNLNLEEDHKLKEEVENTKQSYEKEIAKLKEEIEKLKSETVIIPLRKEPSSLTNTANDGRKIEELNFLLSEEKMKCNKSNLQIKGLEEALKALNAEYNTLSFKYGKLQSDCEYLEKTITDMRRNNFDTKDKFEDLAKINNDLKCKLIENENSLRLHNEDVKSLLKRIAGQQKTIEELDGKNKQTSAELAYKEERLKAIRLMNAKMEQKSQQILKRFEAFRMFEEKSNELSANSQKMYEMIEDLNSRLAREVEEKENHKHNSDRLVAEMNKVNSDYEETRKQLHCFKLINEELATKNGEFENKFKRSLDYRLGDSRDNSIIKDRPINKSYYSNAMTNINQKQTELPVEELKPAKVVINNNNLEVLHK